MIFPKFRGDLVACAAVAKAMHDGAVEATRYPRNPLDIVAQQVVAMAAMDDWDVDALFAAIRGAAPFAELSRTVFDGVLDMLSGRYPSDEFAELRPRVTWDRVAGTVSAREGAKRVAIANGGTIPDRGLYGVFLVGAGPGAARVGELDEEMVFESRAGETFVLGASSWRIEEITHDRVLVSPAPGEPGKMPFWKGDRAGRPLELGLAIGQLMHDLLELSAGRRGRSADARARSRRARRREPARSISATSSPPPAPCPTPGPSSSSGCATSSATGASACSRRAAAASTRRGRWRSPPRSARKPAVDVETLWGDDGFVVRFPDVDQPPDPRLLLPDPDEVQALVVRQLGATALFAAKFRENAARSLLLPKRRPGQRAPLWQQRKRAADLLAVASRYGSFPVLLETYRECLRDFFDMPALIVDARGHPQPQGARSRPSTRRRRRRSPRRCCSATSPASSTTATRRWPSAARRRWPSISRSCASCSAMPSCASCSMPTSMDAIERQLQRLDPQYRVKSADGVHDMLLSLGDLTEAEVRARR